MKIPIKLNKTYWPKMLTRILPSADDPKKILDKNITNEEFSKTVSVFKFGTTFKTTTQNRFPLTISQLKKTQDASNQKILDIGSSDGITTLNLIENLDFEKFYVTDVNIELFSYTLGKKTYFYNTNHECILLATNMFIVYPDYKKSIFPFGKIAKYLLSKTPIMPSTAQKTILINPELMKLARHNILIKKYDIFDEWNDDKVDLITIANLLNKSYFSDNRIITAFGNALNALKDAGRIVIIDNRCIEKSTIFYIDNKKIISTRDINGGTEIKNLIMRSINLSS